jgi:predicted metal-dependent hydrolase
MTSLQVRKIRFDFEDEVPFLWNPDNPIFSAQINATSIIAIAFERFIVSAVQEVLPTLTDPAVYEEAHAFLLQEGQHSRCHRQHVAALVRRHPGLQQTLDAAVASYDALTATKSLAFRLAYVADLEATFTPTFKLMLDNEANLFAGGDERVASLFLWHFVEEVEHRSSGLIVYNAAVTDRGYRTRVLPQVVRHLDKILKLIIDGFNEHVPAEQRGADARMILPAYALRQRAVERARRTTGRLPSTYAGVPWSERLTASYRVLLSQLPGHDPAHEPLPAFADRWFRHFEDGGDVAHWYRSTGVNA